MAERELVAGFAVVAIREDSQWQCSTLDERALGDLDAALTELGRVRSTGAVLAMLAVDDEFFVVIRPSPRKTSLLLSDAAAALDYDIAADVLDMLRAPTPSEEDDDVWAEGDLELLADFGLPGEELEMIAGDIDLYPDEQLQMIAQRCGFAEAFSELADQL